MFCEAALNLYAQRLLPRSRLGAFNNQPSMHNPNPFTSQRTFIRAQGSHKAIQIQAIGLSLYEPVEGTTAQQIGTEVIRTQWLYVPASRA